LSAEAFISRIKSPVKLSLFMLGNLPSAFFSGLRIKSMTPQICVVTVPYKWFTRNPFRSTYFACLSMAAEMSTGALALAHIYGRETKISMLVLGYESSYHKKAIGITCFTCNEGDAIKSAIDAAVQSGEPVVLKVKTTGTDKDGNLIAEATVTWSFKAKK
jgi:hypothetical protein